MSLTWLTLRYHNGRYRDVRRGVSMLAVDIERYQQIAYEVRIAKATVDAFLATPGAAIVGVRTAERLGLETGDRVVLNPIGAPVDEWSFEMVGTWDYGLPSRYEPEGLFVDYAHVDQTLSAEDQGLVAVFVVRIHDARQAGAIGAAIDERFRNSSAPTVTTRTREASMSGRHPGQVRIAANAIVGAFFAILFCTAGVMAQSVRDRYAEFAMMKSFGFGGGALLAGIAGESVAICLVGALLGLVPAALVDAGALLGRYGTIVYPPPPSLYVFGFGVALLLAVASVALPGWRVLRLSPAEVAR